MGAIVRRSPLVARLAAVLGLPEGSHGCTGSYLCGLETGESDVDLVVYGRTFFSAQKIIRRGIARGNISPVSDEIWETIYRKRRPELPRDEFSSTRDERIIGERSAGSISISSSPGPMMPLILHR